MHCMLGYFSGVNHSIEVVLRTHSDEEAAHVSLWAQERRLSAWRISQTKFLLPLVKEVHGRAPSGLNHCLRGVTPISYALMCALQHGALCGMRGYCREAAMFPT